MMQICILNKTAPLYVVHIYECDDNLVLSTKLMMQIGLNKEILKLTFWALVLPQNKFALIKN